MTFKKELNLVSFCLILIGLLSGLLLIKFIPQFPIISDYADYDNIGQSLAQGNGYFEISNDRVIYPPLYPFFLSVIYFFFGHNYDAVYLFQFVLLSLLSSLIYLICRKLLKIGVIFALLFSLLIIFWPYFILYSLVISTEILFSLLLLISILTFLIALRNKRVESFIISGLFFSLATLTRPVSLLLPFWLIFWLTIYNYFKSKEKKDGFSLKLLAIFIVVYLLALSPWVGFVYYNYGKLIPVSSNLSAVFSKANSTLAYLGEEKKGVANGWKEVGRAKLNNVYLFWNPGASGYQMDRVANRFPFANYALWLYRVGFIIILTLAAIAARKLYQSEDVFILILTIIYFWALHTVLFPFPRYTLPVIPLVVILASFSTFTLINGYFHRQN